MRESALPPREIWAIVDADGVLHTNHFDYESPHAARRQATEDDSTYPGDAPHIVHRYVLVRSGAPEGAEP